ncbi:thiamine biosynthesis protein ThiS [Moraxella caviae]|uniref:Sulfur carrier protein ThiS n=1 Tax=Moraxella caviae TaxID=34060 RepID=A0A1T0AAM9_9GAMM|nr:sulfur carrier protein ThiS [Moraxella caviae]OOR92796.1 thiamine biosynthesis protein ThiS [Moraxella caviae]STZ14167.1 sulfur carrier protein ThiS [Moraxella caviae]VEW12613.1 sulfur carrier protein ThiS [Moraxella caviae]
MKTITINGQLKQTREINVLALLESLSLTQGRFAVEIDGALAPKSKLADTTITDGMKIEVVQAVGGG